MNLRSFQSGDKVKARQGRGWSEGKVVAVDMTERTAVVEFQHKTNTGTFVQRRQLAALEPA